jgi:hypothetical protein
MRGGVVALSLNLEHGVTRACLCRSGSAKGHGKIRGLYLSQLLARLLELVDALGGFGREEFNAENSL